ncbi:hypothetical protein C8R42DRAFT_638072 [Lentinula raphanica]|nr:hypothetical protein C8R42DRAFT_638072 [Lentinula raphanica]
MNYGSSQADRVRWLLDDKRYHQEVDLEIDHSITEWTSGRKKKIQLTRANTVESYLFLWRTVEKSKKRAKTYIEDLPFDLFEEMMSNDIGDEDVPNYDYEAIEAAAQEKRKKRLLGSGNNEGSGVDNTSDIYDDDRSNNGSNDGSHSGSNKGSNNGSNKEDEVDNGFNTKGNDNVFGSDNVNVSDNGREIDRNGSFETKGDDVDSNEV